MGKKDLIAEVQSLLGIKWQKAKKIVKLAEEPPGTVRRINTSTPREYMSQSVAAKHVADARARIALVDEGD